MLNEKNTTALKAVMKQVLQFEVGEGKKLDRSRLTDTVKVAETVIKCMEDGIKEIQIKAPTGSGKSLIAFILSMYSEIVYAQEKKVFQPIDNEELPKPCYIVTPRKSLQEQYIRDIQKFKLDYPVMKGQNSYSCLKDESRTFANRPCAKHAIGKLAEEMDCGKTCPYVLARTEAIHKDICVMNNHYLITALLNNHREFKPRKLLIIDESHQFTQILRDMYSVNLTFSESKITLIEVLMQMKSYSGEVPIDYDDIVEQLHQVTEEMDVIAALAHGDTWIEKLPEIAIHLGVVSKKMSKIITEISTVFEERDEENELVYNDLYIDEVKEVLALYTADSDTVGRVYTAVAADHGNLIVDITEKGLKFSLMKVDKMYNALFKDFGHVIFMTATPSDTFFEELGVEGKRFNIKSKFSVKTSPVVIPTDMLVNMSFLKRNENFNDLFKSTEKICTLHLTKPKKPNNGFVHTGSYAFQSMMQEYFFNMGMNDNFIWCDKTPDIEAGMLHLEQNPDSGLILVSPSILEGVDGNGATARFQIALKCPFPSMQDRYIQRLINENRTLYNELVRQTVEQLIGRVQRSPKDIGITYLLDESFATFIKHSRLDPHCMAKIQRIAFSHIDKVFTDIGKWSKEPATKILGGDYEGLYM